MSETQPSPYDRLHDPRLETPVAIGLGIVRSDAVAKVTGAARYAHDYQPPSSPAHAWVLGARIARGGITSIDVAAAMRMSGVQLVMTHLNAPKQAALEPFRVANRLEKARPELVDPTIRYRGQAIALVVADTIEIAREAAELIEVEYAQADAATDLQAGITTAYRPEMVGPRLPAETSVGDVDTALLMAAVSIDAIYDTAPQHHHPMEPPAALACWNDGELTVWCSQQNIGAARLSLAKTLQLPAEKVRVVSTYVGGGFGSKLPINPDSVLAALAARVLERPVRLALGRGQLAELTGHRGAFRQRVRIGADARGRIDALAHHSLSGTARHEEYAEQSAAPARSLYAVRHLQTDHRLVLLDLPHTESMRAPGEAPGLLALESAMDELSVASGIDPVELRLRNEPLVEPGSGRSFGKRRLVECIREGAQRFGWRGRHQGGRDGRLMIGHGMAVGLRPDRIGSAKASITLTTDAQLVAKLDLTDIGTGSYTVLAQVIADATGFPLDKILVRLGDSRFPRTTGSGGSLGAGSAGSALLNACFALARRLAASQVTRRRSLVHGLDAQRARLVFPFLVIGDRRVRLDELAVRLAAEHRVAAGSISPARDASTIAAHSYAAHFAEVSVDTRSAEIRVRRMIGVFDVGRVLNARTARSQLIGGMVWGVGGALLEEGVIDHRQGAFVARDLASYHVPVAADIGHLEAICLPPDPDYAVNPIASGGVGEIGICGAGAAVANAVFDATGYRARKFPISPADLLNKLEETAMLGSIDAV